MKIRRTLVLALATCGTLAAGGGGGGGGGTPTQPNPPAQPNVITIELAEFSYSPHQVTIEPGETVRWVLVGSDPGHSVTALDGAFDSGLAFQDTGDAFERTFTAAESGQTFEYSCTSHSDCCDMKGSIRVGESAPAPAPGYQRVSPAREAPALRRPAPCPAPSPPRPATCGRPCARSSGSSACATARGR